MSIPIDAAPADLAFIRAVFARFAPGMDVWLFGSRVTGRARRFSDLDAMIMGERPIDLLSLAELKDAFSESPLPFRVDVLEWATTGDAFRRIVEATHVPLPDAVSALETS